METVRRPLWASIAILLFGALVLLALACANVSRDDWQAQQTRVAELESDNRNLATRVHQTQTTIGPRANGGATPRLVLPPSWDFRQAGIPVAVPAEYRLPKCDREAHIGQPGYAIPEIRNLYWPKDHQPGLADTEREWKGVQIGYGPRDLPRLYGVTGGWADTILLSAVVFCGVSEDGESVFDHIPYELVVAGDTLR